MMRETISSLWKASTATLVCSFGFLGILFTILIPPFQVPDEPVHWTAAYNRTSSSSERDSAGRHCSLANALPGVFETDRIAFHPREKISRRQFRAVASMTPACTESTLNYGIVTTYPGVLAARAVTTGERDFPHKAFQVFILARIFQGAVVFALAWRFVTVSLRAGRLLPGSLVMAATMLAPIFVQQSFAISADAITFALSLSLLFFLFHMSRARWFDWAALLALSITVGATKPPLFSIVPVFLYVGLIRAHMERGTKRWVPPLRSPTALAVHSCVVLALGAALWISSQQSVTAASQPNGGGSNVQNQVAHILAHPSSAVPMLLDVTWGKFASWEPFVGSLGWLDAHMSGWTQSKYKQLLLLSLLGDLALCLMAFLNATDRRSVVRNLAWKLPVNLGLILCLFSAGLCTSFILYITWTPVGADWVAGLQARYFLPMLLPLPLLVGDLFFSGSSEGGAQRMGSSFAKVAGVAVFASAVLSLFFPLYIDLLRRWW